VLKPDGSPFIPGFESYVYVKLRNPDNSGEDICGDSVNDDGTYKLGGNVPEGDICWLPMPTEGIIPARDHSRLRCISAGRQRIGI
jgi:hypothetical protein